MSRNTLLWALGSWLVLSLVGHANAQNAKPNRLVDPRDPIQQIQKDLDELQKEIDRIFNDALQPLPRSPFAPGLNWGGSRLAKVDKITQDQLGLPENEGLAVLSVTPGSEAEKAGLKANDVIVKINGKSVPTDTEAFNKLLKDQKATEQMELGIVRRGKEETLRASMPNQAVASASRRPGFIAPRVPRIEINPFLPNPAEDFNGVTMNFQRNGNDFISKYAKGELSITVTGKYENGVAKPGEITIQESKESKNYSSIADVPQQHRETVQRLMQPTFNNRLIIPRLPNLRDFPGLPAIPEID